MKRTSQTVAGVRSGNFSNAVQFLTVVLKLEIVHYDGGREVARFALPSGGYLELFGSKSLWQPFTNPPDWEVIIADIYDRSSDSLRSDEP